MSTEQPHDGKAEAPSPEKPKQPYIEANYVIRSIIAGMGAIVLGFAGFFLTLFSPLKERVIVVEAKLTGIDEGIKRIEGKVDRAAGVINDKTLPALFMALTTATKEHAEGALTATENLVEIAQDNKLSLSPDKFKEIGRNLVNQDYEKPELKKKARATISKVAKWKTFLTGPVPEEAKKEAQASGKYFVNQRVVLNNAIYDNAVFDSCQIIYQENPLDEDFIALEGVRIFNSDFMIAPGRRGDEFYVALLASVAPYFTIEIGTVVADPSQDRPGADRK